jgi:Flp pilus assembly protein TadG
MRDVTAPARLARPLLRLLGRDDSGAIGVIIGILIGGGVLLGLGALVLDVGKLYSVRAQLQNGADAGALAVAKSCALGSCTPGIAPSYADANSATGIAGVPLVCGSGSLGPCPPSTGALTDCPAAPPAGTHYVDVHTESLNANGSTLVPPILARTLLGMHNYQGSTVLACAQAEWGPPASLSTIAFTISACEWDTATSNGTVFAPPPPYPPNPPAAADQVLTLHSGVTSGYCQANPADADAPGAFGWTQDLTGTCQVVINGSTYNTNTGVSAGQSCKRALYEAWLNKTVVYVPVYSSVVGQGSGTVYTLKGFAAFVITGYRIPGSGEPDWLNPSLLCHPPNVCIDGVFTQGLIPLSDLPGGVGGNNLGAYVVKLTG